jgi:hypothetical protein
LRSHYHALPVALVDAPVFPSFGIGSHQMQAEAANRRFAEAGRLAVQGRRSRIERWAFVFHLCDDAGPVASYLNFDSAALVVINAAMFDNVGDCLDQNKLKAKCAAHRKLVGNCERLHPLA